MSKRKKIDYILLISVLFLILLGILMIFSISASSSQKIFGTSFYFLKHQFIFGILPATILGFIAFRLKMSHFKRLSPALLFLNLVLLLMVFLPEIGILRGGARRWIGMGDISFQPSELLKITLFLYLAAWLSKRPKKDLPRTFLMPKLKVGDLSNFLYFWLILTPIIIILIFQRDISTLAILLSVSFFMYFLAETPFWHSILTIAMGCALIIFLMSFEPYRFERLLVFLKPQIDPMGMGYQIKQMLITIGSGGIFGKGLGMSKQKFGLVPNPMSDSIFAIFCEETGIIGPIILISLFMIFLIRGLKISKRAHDRFTQLFAAGLTLQIVLQAFLNIASLIGILPLTGTPLPFISYGGSHIIAELLAVGILLNISKNC